MIIKERYGVPEKRLKQSKIIRTVIKIPLMGLGLFLAVGGFGAGIYELGVVGLFLFILPEMIGKSDFRYVEIDEKGIKQGKNFIEWSNIATVLKSRSRNIFTRLLPRLILHNREYFHSVFLHRAHLLKYSQSFCR